MAQTFLSEDVQSEKKVDSIEVKAPAKRLPDGISILKDVMTREPGLERNMTDIDRWENMGDRVEGYCFRKARIAS